MKDLKNSDLLNIKKINRINKPKLSLFGENNGRKFIRPSLKRKTQSTGKINFSFLSGKGFNSNEIKVDNFFKGRESIISIKEEEEEDIQKEQQKERLKKFLAETSELENKQNKNIICEK